MHTMLAIIFSLLLAAACVTAVPAPAPTAAPRPLMARQQDAGASSAISSIKASATTSSFNAAATRFPSCQHLIYNGQCCSSGIVIDDTCYQGSSRIQIAGSTISQDGLVFVASSSSSHYFLYSDKLGFHENGPWQVGLGQGRTWVVNGHDDGSESATQGGYTGIAGAGVGGGIAQQVQSELSAAGIGPAQLTSPGYERPFPTGTGTGTGGRSGESSFPGSGSSSGSTNGVAGGKAAVAVGWTWASFVLAVVGAAVLL